MAIKQEAINTLVNCKKELEHLELELTSSGLPFDYLTEINEAFDKLAEKITEAEGHLVQQKDAEPFDFFSLDVWGNNEDEEGWVVNDRMKLDDNVLLSTEIKPQEVLDWLIAKGFIQEDVGLDHLTIEIDPGGLIEVFDSGDNRPLFCFLSTVEPE